MSHRYIQTWWHLRHLSLSKRHDGALSNQPHRLQRYVQIFVGDNVTSRVLYLFKWNNKKVLNSFSENILVIWHIIVARCLLNCHSSIYDNNSSSKYSCYRYVMHIASDIIPKEVSITLHYVTLRYVALRYVTLRYVTLHYITSHYITLHHITLHYIVAVGVGFFPR